jgi:hypothetical protein
MGFLLGEYIDPTYRRPGRGCGQKRSYETEAQAATRLRELLTTGGVSASTRYYRCFHCGVWHLGVNRMRPVSWFQTDGRRERAVAISPFTS